MTTPTVAQQLLVFLLPDLGEGLTEAELVSWLVAEGDAVAVDQPVAEVETAKSVVEVPSPFAGTVAVLHGRPGEVLDVGAPFLTVRPEGMEAPAPAEEQIEDAAAGLREDAGVPTTATRPDDHAPTVSEGSGNVLIGYGTPGGPTGGRTRPRKGAARRSREVGAVPGDGQAPHADIPAPAGEPSDRRAPLCISPLVRKLARDHAIRLADVAGSGDEGLILRRDIDALIEARPGAPVAAEIEGGSGPAGSARDGSPAETAAPAAGRDSRSGLVVLDRAPLRGVRRTIADAMSRSRREIPEATVWVDVDVTALVDLREGLKRRTPDGVPGILAFVARFVVAGLARYPELNSRIATGDDGSQELVRVDGVNLGIAAQTGRGLVVPSVRRADTMTARELDLEIRRLATLAREGKATPSDLSSGTFTLNNYGVFGVDGSAAIINYPESAILGMGRIMDRPWVVDGQLAVRKVTELTLAFDHRVCDGGTAGGFLRFVADAMENPGGMLADL
ncbi:2-oxo acid dehydrogenase subunit E2 [Arthrobacter agilis]|uniref:dihydrolipoamide acetyltransferase family protein n=1 Tax=Arthrobacter agilis TaxID=37921 RepID=UPI000B362C8B|nr:dihydrolipoamide acetyltransferase family protein [Arthrobacter agilis]OUM42967.1 branched-chain alpha-keto acid dehydrogenase subunit E2 [Arthrobacter agilis]PPB45912.1 2-oxo acid dehydrogenase subunit E2 [Arthrobacter agilis]TPV25453.1 2-oxo acid dehydrogenase subunit E2 [Arthrobacter agilis]VDR33194.1 Dihydrolipoyllysine-residue acetyltransferase component of pyruvate dehydrogenase complex [Arthrobacter agilis]